MPSGSHDDAQGSHDHCKISIPASELTWKKSPGVSGTHMLVFKCHPLGAMSQVSSDRDTRTPIISKSDGLESSVSSSQHKHNSKTTMLQSSHELNGCNGISSKKETVSKLPSDNKGYTGPSNVTRGSIVPGSIVKKSNNGMIVYDKHRSILNGCQMPTSVASMHAKNSVKKAHKTAEQYKAFNSKPVAVKKLKKRKPRRTALALLLAESEQFRSNGSVNDDDSSLGSPLSVEDTDNSIEVLDDLCDSADKRNMSGQSYAKADANGVEPPSAKRPRLMEGAEVSSMLKGVCSAELVVFDSRNKCLLQDGQYELMLQECETPSPAAGSPLTWNTVFGGSGQVNVHVVCYAGCKIHVAKFKTHN